MRNLIKTLAIILIASFALVGCGSSGKSLPSSSSTPTATPSATPSATPGNNTPENNSTENNSTENNSTENNSSQNGQVPEDGECLTGLPC
ncbi:MAG TPA: hypothetical protein ENK88_07590 [Campylobacterales bacterium]|nr:hypothetical protein [Campylobacterales bacterium]